MGRPPIGKVAMSATQRVRRYRERLLDQSLKTKPETKQAARLAELKADIAKLTAAQIVPLIFGNVKRSTAAKVGAELIRLTGTVRISMHRVGRLVGR